MRWVATLAVLVWAAPADGQTLRRPVACSDCIANWFYFDQVAGGGVGDWSCAASTYGGHRGTDFSLAGGVPAIDAGHDIVAAADGTVVSAVDGHYDRCRTCDAAVDPRCGTGFGGGYGNHVVINHGSYRVIYAHMRMGSVRVTNGQAVRCGDAIGQIGSSGCTTGAHVHFETRPLGGSSGASAFDPFAGMCSPTAPSLWVGQGPHRGLPDATCDATAACPPGTFDIWTCDPERTRRRRCSDGNDQIEPCPFGCLSMPVGTDDECAAPPDDDMDGSAADVDCDDTDPDRHPGRVEVCGDGVDQDCDDEDLPCDAGVSRDAAVGVDAGTDAGSRVGELEGGCGCRVRPSDDGPLALWVGLLALVRRRACGARRTPGGSATRSPPSARRTPPSSA